MVNNSHKLILPSTKDFSKLKVNHIFYLLLNQSIVFIHTCEPFKKDRHVFRKNAEGHLHRRVTLVAGITLSLNSMSRHESIQTTLDRILKLWLFVKAFTCCRFTFFWSCFQHLWDEGRSLREHNIYFRVTIFSSLQGQQLVAVGDFASVGPRLVANWAYAFRIWKLKLIELQVELVDCFC